MLPARRTSAAALCQDRQGRLSWSTAVVEAFRLAAALHKRPQLGVSSTFKTKQAARAHLAERSLRPEAPAPASSSTAIRARLSISQAGFRLLQKRTKPSQQPGGG